MWSVCDGGGDGRVVCARVNEICTEERPRVVCVYHEGKAKGKGENKVAVNLPVCSV